MLDLKCSVKQLYSLLMCMYICTSSYPGQDFNDTVIVTEIPAGQTQLVQAIQIFDDEINEGREVFNVSLEVVGNISIMVTYRIQTTLCRIRQSDRKLSCCKDYYPALDHVIICTSLFRGGERSNL